MPATLPNGSKSTLTSMPERFWTVFWVLRLNFPMRAVTQGVPVLLARPLAVKFRNLQVWVSWTIPLQICCKCQCPILVPHFWILVLNWVTAFMRMTLSIWKHYCLPILMSTNWTCCLLAQMGLPTMATVNTTFKTTTINISLMHMVLKLLWPSQPKLSWKITTLVIT